MAIVKAMTTLNINFGHSDQQVSVCWTRDGLLYKSIHSLSRGASCECATSMGLSLGLYPYRTMPGSSCISQTPSKRAQCPRRWRTSSCACGRTRASRPVLTGPQSISSTTLLDSKETQRYIGVHRPFEGKSKKGPFFSLNLFSRREHCFLYHRGTLGQWFATGLTSGPTLVNISLIHGLLSKD